MYWRNNKEIKQYLDRSNLQFFKIKAKKIKRNFSVNHQMEPAYLK